MTVVVRQVHRRTRWRRRHSPFRACRKSSRRRPRGQSRRAAPPRGGQPPAQHTVARKDPAPPGPLLVGGGHVRLDRVREDVEGVPLLGDAVVEEGRAQPGGVRGVRERARRLVTQRLLRPPRQLGQGEGARVDDTLPTSSRMGVCCFSLLLLSLEENVVGCDGRWWPRVVVRRHRRESTGAGMCVRRGSRGRPRQRGSRPRPRRGATPQSRLREAWLLLPTSL